MNENSLYTEDSDMWLEFKNGHSLTDEEIMQGWAEAQLVGSRL